MRLTRWLLLLLCWYAASVGAAHLIGRALDIEHTATQRAVDAALGAQP